MLSGFSVHCGKKLDEIFLSVVLQRKAKDKENAKSPVTTSTQASTPRDSIFVWMQSTTGHQKLFLTCATGKQSCPATLAGVPRFRYIYEDLEISTN